MAKAIATPGARPVASMRTAREIRSTSRIVPRLMDPVTDSRRGPQVLRLTFENGRVEAAIGVDGGSLPQQQSLDGECRIARVEMRARGIGVAIAALLDHLDHARRELPARIGEV